MWRTGSIVARGGLMSHDDSVTRTPSDAPAPRFNFSSTKLRVFKKAPALIFFSVPAKMLARVVALLLLAAPVSAVPGQGVAAADASKEQLPPKYLGLYKKASVSKRSAFKNKARKRHLVLSCEGSSQATGWHGTTTLSWLKVCGNPVAGCPNDPKEGHAALGSQVRAGQESWKCGGAITSAAAALDTTWGVFAGCPTSNNVAGRAACVCVPIQPPSGTASDFLKLNVPIPQQAKLMQTIVEFDNSCALAVHVGELTGEVGALKVATELAYSSSADHKGRADKLQTAAALARRRADIIINKCNNDLIAAQATCPLTSALGTAVVAVPPKAAYAKLTLDCSKVVVQKSWTAEVRSKTLMGKMIACTYSSEEPEPPTGNGPALPPVKVPVLVFYTTEADPKFALGFALAARGHDQNKLELSVLVAGFELDGNTDPVGSSNAIATGKLSTLEVKFPHTKVAKKDITLANRQIQITQNKMSFTAFTEVSGFMRNIGAIAYICGGNTGRSPVAEAIAASTLGEAGLYDVARVFSRTAGDALGGEGEFIEADVRNAVARLGPTHFRLREHLDQHRARPSTGHELAFARVILTASNAHANMVKGTMKKYYMAEKKRAAKNFMVATGEENIFTIKEWINAATQGTNAANVADPFDVKAVNKNNPDVTARAFETMVLDMIKHVPAGARRAAHGLFPVADVFANA